MSSWLPVACAGAPMRLIAVRPAAAIAATPTSLVLGFEVGPVSRPRGWCHSALAAVCIGVARAATRLRTWAARVGVVIAGSFPENDGRSPSRRILPYKDDHVQMVRWEL